MPALNLRHRLRPILPKFQLPPAVDTEKSAQHLPHKVQHVPVRLNVVLRVDGKQLPPVGHGLNLRLRVLHLHVTGLTAQFQKRPGIPHGLKPVEVLLKPEHIVIGFQFQAVRRPVRLADLKNTHRHFLIFSTLHPQMVGQLHLRPVQRIPVNLRKQSDPHFRSIHRSKLNLRTPAALGRNVTAPLHDILISERIHRTAFHGNLPRPIIPPGIFLHRLQERLAHRIHENTPFHTKSTSHS